MFFQLFLTYLKIGTFTIGGGYAMLALIQREVVDRRGWIDEEEFLNMIALAQAAPGIIAVNSAIFIGWRIGGWRGVAGARLAYRRMERRSRSGLRGGTAVLRHHPADRYGFQRMERVAGGGSRLQGYPSCRGSADRGAAGQVGEKRHEEAYPRKRRGVTQRSALADFVSRRAGYLARSC